MKAMFVSNRHATISFIFAAIGFSQAGSSVTDIYPAERDVEAATIASHHGILAISVIFTVLPSVAVCLR